MIVITMHCAIIVAFLLDAFVVVWPSRGLIVVVVRCARPPLVRIFKSISPTPIFVLL